MDVIVCFILLLVSILAAMLWDFPLPLALLVGYVAFAAATLHRGFSVKELVHMTFAGAASSAVVLKVLVCIGILTAVWRIGGTLPILVYEGIRLIHPQWFLLCVFLLSAGVSFLIGSSFGTAGTIGVGLMILARAGGVETALAAGAVMSGIYFGDRGSPASSCASLVAALTGTKLYDNIAQMMKSAGVACGMTLLLYAVLSPFYPLHTVSSSDNLLLQNIQEMFSLHPYAFLPAAAILLLPLFKVGIKIAMTVSSLLAAIGALYFEQVPVAELLKSLLWGYVPTQEGAFAAVIGGGGLFSMLNVMLIIFISASYSGIFQETKMLHALEAKLMQLSQKIGLFPTIICTSLATASVASNQTLSIILVRQLMYPLWQAEKLPPTQRALHLADSVVTISGLVPWNIACAMPLVMLDSGVEALPFSFLLYLIPLVGLVIHRRKKCTVRSHGFSDKKEICKKI